MAKIAKSAVPNTFTLGNLGCGIMSLMMTFQQNYRWACLFILIAGLMDRYDGRVARFLKVDSPIGKELDSLADLVSFGVAPSILIFHTYNFVNFGILGYILVLLFPIAGAYRLAKFNITEFDGQFSGIPITIAGMILALFNFVTLGKNVLPTFTVILVVALSYLMVSNVKLKKF